MEAFKIENLTFTYPNSNIAALKNISLTINEGEFIVVCGASGSGKSTLLRQLARGGIKDGIGFVGQSVEDAIVTDKVWHELAFGLENLGVESSEIRARVAETASFFGIHTWFHRDTASLSGGQKQLLNLASVMVMQPKTLILDEPTAQLDPIAAQDLLAAVKRVNSELGVTVVMSEHRLEDALGICDRVLALSDGAVLADCKPSALCRSLSGHDMLRALPTSMRVYSALGGGDDAPVTIRAGRDFLREYAKTHEVCPIVRTDIAERGETAVELKNVYFRYEKRLDDVLRGLNMRVCAGEIYAITGGNGAGKSTALGAIGGVNKPYRGSVDVRGTVGAVTQNVRLMFSKKTVRAELYEMTDDVSAIDSVIGLCALEELTERHPYDLSGGEQQRLAIGKVLLLKPDILLLDEPTKGMDACFKTQLASILTTLKNEGTAVIIVSHDIEFCAEYADRCAMLFDGAVASEGAAREFFMSNSFYTTAARRMSRQLLGGAVTAKDIVNAFGKQCEKKDFDDKRQNLIEETPRAEEKPKPRTCKVTKQTVLTAAVTLAAMALTIFIGDRFFGGRKYYFISMLIIFETIIPFAFVFERQKPRTCLLVTMSVLCAIAVAGRGAFYMIPQFKPMTAVVIIAGAALGGEAGFVIGAVSAFVSNMFFGQGPWTPWQMLALGITGLTAGILFYGRKPRRIMLAIYGFAVTITVYGLLMNISSVVQYQSVLTLEMIAAEVALGFPFDLIHASATAFFLLIAALPMLDKIERVKVKYGLR